MKNEKWKRFKDWAQIDPMIYNIFLIVPGTISFGLGLLCSSPVLQILINVVLVTILSQITYVMYVTLLIIVSGAVDLFDDSDRHSILYRMIRFTINKFGWWSIIIILLIFKTVILCTGILLSRTVA
jgi:hypothetical protein